MKKKGHVIVLSGPSGVGKGSLIQAILASCSSISLAISVTTRQKRSNEQQGIHYHFKTDKDFDALIKQDAFLEWCPVHQHRYGTLKKTVFESIKKGQHLLIEVDTQGFEKIRLQLPILSIFIAPPSLDSLANRLYNRNTDSPGSIQKRLIIAKKELTMMNNYDYIVTNDQLEQAKETIKSILKKEVLL